MKPVPCCRSFFAALTAVPAAGPKQPSHHPTLWQRNVQCPHGTAHPMFCQNTGKAARNPRSFQTQNPKAPHVPNLPNGLTDGFTSNLRRSFGGPKPNAFLLRAQTSAGTCSMCSLPSPPSHHLQPWSAAGPGSTVELGPAGYPTVAEHSPSRVDTW